MSNMNTESSKSEKAVLTLAAQQDMRKLLVDEIASDLLRKLQTSLDVEQILSWFLKGTEKILGLMNCTLITGEDEFSITEMKRARHKVNYNLALEGQHLGAIEFSRNRKFAEDELAVIETLMGCLIYPLRNGIHYREAVNAAMSDALTGIANKRAFDYQIHHEVAISQRYGSKLSLAIFDVDFFKKVNDTYGHATGDAVLKQIVEVVKHNCRDSDMVFRLGGEEFGILLTKTDPEGAYAIADRIREAIAETTFCYNGHKIPVSVSIGISTHNNVESKVSFIGRADQALYAAKNSGRNRTVSAASQIGPTEELVASPNIVTAQDNDKCVG